MIEKTKRTTRMNKTVNKNGDTHISAKIKPLNKNSHIDTEEQDDPLVRDGMAIGDYD